MHCLSQPPKGTWTNQPPFIYHKNPLTVNYKEGAYYYSYKFPGAPRYTPLQEEALRWEVLWGSTLLLIVLRIACQADDSPACLMIIGWSLPFVAAAPL